jgi:hypothetical protein
MSKTLDSRLSILSARAKARLLLQSELKRRVHPAAAFGDLVELLREASGADDEVRNAFALVKKNLGGVAVRQSEALRMAELEKSGVSASEFAVGWLPASFGPGLALMYDGTLEALRSLDDEIETKVTDVRILAAIADSLEEFMSFIGESSVTALEMAANDEDYRKRLKNRAEELSRTHLPPRLALFPPPVGPCEFCQISEKTSDGFYLHRCGSEEECGNLGIVIVVVIVVLLLKAWLEDLF